jgi:hypothetical protein
MGKSWRSTVSACVSACGMFIIFASAAPYNVRFPVTVSALAAFMALGGLASLGINTKDSEVTGGNIVQPGIPVAVPTPVAIKDLAATPAQAVIADSPATPILAKSVPAFPLLRKW